MVVVAQLVRASVCGTEGRGFETHLPPIKPGTFRAFLFHYKLICSHTQQEKWVRQIIAFIGVF